MMRLRMALKSLRYRRASAALTVVAIAMALVIVVLGQRVTEGVKEGLYAGARGIDLIVARPSGDVQIVMHALYQLGAGGAGLSPADQALVSALEDVDWVVPIALGDSHRGVAVMATAPDYVRHLSDARGQPIRFATGAWPDDWRSVVLGAQAANRLGYATGQSIQLSHGSGTGLERSHDQVLRVTGILAPTGTPLDNRILVSLQADRIVHGADPDADGAVTALLLGAKRKVGIFRIQRQIDRSTEGRVTAVIPAAALTQLWQLLGVVQSSARLFSGLILLFAGLSLVTLMLMNWQQRRRECWVLRAMGCSLGFALSVQAIEGLVIAALAVALAMLTIALGSGALGHWVMAEYGILIAAPDVNYFALGLFSAAIAICLVFSLLPTLLSWRGQVQRGLTETV